MCSRKKTLSNQVQLVKIRWIVRSRLSDEKAAVSTTLWCTLAPKPRTMEQTRQLTLDPIFNQPDNFTTPIFTPIDGRTFAESSTQVSGQSGDNFYLIYVEQRGGLTFGVDSSRWRPQVALKPKRRSATAGLNIRHRCCHRPSPQTWSELLQLHPQSNHIYPFHAHNIIIYNSPAMVREFDEKWPLFRARQFRVFPRTFRLWRPGPLKIGRPNRPLDFCRQINPDEDSLADISISI